jgi:hypothetical protein
LPESGLQVLLPGVPDRRESAHDRADRGDGARKPNTAQSTDISSARGTIGGTNARSTGISSRASATPRTAPAKASIELSASN